MIACKVAAEKPCVHLYAQRSLPVLKYSQLLRLCLVHPLQEYMHSRLVLAVDLWNTTSLRHTACWKHELDKLTVLAWADVDTWADVKTTSMTHAELLMQRHSAALKSTTKVRLLVSLIVFRPCFCWQQTECKGTICKALCLYCQPRIWCIGFKTESDLRVQG